MNFKRFLLATLALCFFLQTSNAQTKEDSQEQDITVFESVLSTAAWANFKYEDLLLAAKMGDHKATLKLLEFSGTVDGVAELEHSVTMLELLASGGDATFAAALNMAKPKLKSILLQRLQLAQGRTKNENLREPLEKWAPITWSVFNGKAFIPPTQSLTSESQKNKEKAAKAKSNIIDFDALDAAPTQSSDTPISTQIKGKQ